MQIVILMLTRKIIIKRTVESKRCPTMKTLVISFNPIKFSLEQTILVVSRQAFILCWELHQVWEQPSISAVICVGIKVTQQNEKSTQGLVIMWCICYSKSCKMLSMPIDSCHFFGGFLNLVLWQWLKVVSGVVWEKFLPGWNAPLIHGCAFHWPGGCSVCFSIA